MTATGDDLAQLIAAELASPVPRGAQLVAERIRARHGESVRAIVFYGSCLRTGDDEFSLLDLYVLVDSYWRIGTRRLYAALNALLPPNVYYTEFADGERTLRAKYAVVTLDDFARHTAANCFQPYFWGRFAQPCALIYAADDATARAVTNAFADAVTTFVRNALPLVALPCSVRALWTTQLSESYRAELRAERESVAERLYDAAAERYDRITRAALARFSFTPPAAVVDGTVQLPARPASSRAAALWRLRRAWGKWLSLLRILKSALTQEGSLDYALWKVERHSGVPVDKSWRQKPHPLLALGEELWRIYRKGAFR
jgi:predicted nucleotidyltransferase